MSASNPARCLLTRSSMSRSKAFTPCRNFHSTSVLPERRRPRFANVKAVDMGLISSPSKDGLRPYEAKEKMALAKRYTPEQLKVIEAGEEAINLDDIRNQGMFRTDPYRLPYLDDLSVVHPVVDKRFPEPRTIPENSRWMDDQEAEDEFGEWMHKAMLASRPKNSTLQAQSQGEEKSGSDKKIAGGPEQVASDAADLKFVRAEFLKYMESAPGVTGSGTMGSTSLAPALPKIPDMKGQYKMAAMDPRDPEGKYNRLIKQTGLTLDDILAAKVKILVRHSVVNQTRLGKIQSVYVLAIAGDGQGRLGLGEAKGIELEETSDKAKQAAIRSMKPIQRYEGRTIFGEVEGKVAACEVKLMARPPGNANFY